MSRYLEMYLKGGIAKQGQGAEPNASVLLGAAFKPSIFKKIAPTLGSGKPGAVTVGDLNRFTEGSPADKPSAEADVHRIFADDKAAANAGQVNAADGLKFLNNSPKARGFLEADTKKLMDMVPKTESK